MRIGSRWALEKQAVAGVTSGLLALGDWVTWRAKHFGIRFRLTSTVTAWDRPVRFVDEQTRGPFASWWHEYRFEPAGGGTRMVDTVVFASPLGPIGRLVDFVVLGRYMCCLIERRNAWIQRELG
jgi:ligand-binding SRPBCC domain-containing protein